MEFYLFPAKCCVWIHQIEERERKPLRHFGFFASIFFFSVKNVENYVQQVRLVIFSFFEWNNAVLIFKFFLQSHCDVIHHSFIEQKITPHSYQRIELNKMAINKCFTIIIVVRQLRIETDSSFWLHFFCHIDILSIQSTHFNCDFAWNFFLYFIN